MAAGYAITTGNELGVEMTDYVRYFATRSELKTIICFVESLRDGARFAREVRTAAEQGKTVFCLSEVGALPAGPASRGIAHRQAGRILRGLRRPHARHWSNLPGHH